MGGVSAFVGLLLLEAVVRRGIDAEVGLADGVEIGC